ncbi:ribbon-helix-helix domain-containing protein [Natrarchaeobaculum sulfurireducens]|uniref:ribbon-helix-helix domain-containing protein n=1 Tax=Natrarchaeobaculum sulfurireducens TaxID=2044521 RepID=UPI00105AB106|nr:hypothetical protein [Natrarchaeobaculum sulfurireducens]
MVKNRVTIRVPKEVVKEWDNHVDASNEYHNRSHLIRDSVNSNISDSTTERRDINVDITPIEDRLDSIESQMKRLSESTEQLQSSVSYLLDLETDDGVDLTTDLFKDLPTFETSNDAYEAINEYGMFDDPDGIRATQYGRLDDLKARYMAYSESVVNDAIDTLVNDVDAVRQLNIDGNTFIFEVEE